MPHSSSFSKRSVVFSSRELIWGGGEVFLHDLYRELKSRGFSTFLRVHQKSELANRAVSADLLSPNRLTFGKTIVCNDFRSVWKSILFDRWASRIFLIHGPWQISPLRILICRIFRVRGYAVSHQLVEACIDLGLRNVCLLPIGPRLTNVQIKRPISRKVELVVGQISRLDPIKRIDIFTELVVRNQVRGVLVCSGKAEGEFIEIIKNAESSGLAVYTDGNPEHVWQKCNLYVCTSRFESLGLALLEALSFGIPVVSLAEGGPKELLTSVLSLGQLSGTAVKDIDFENVYSRIQDNWSEYWSEAQQLLASRNISKCADVLLGSAG